MRPNNRSFASYSQLPNRIQDQNNKNQNWNSLGRIPLAQRTEQFSNPQTVIQDQVDPYFFETDPFQPYQNEAQTKGQESYHQPEEDIPTANTAQTQKQAMKEYPSNNPQTLFVEEIRKEEILQDSPQMSSLSQSPYSPSKIPNLASRYSGSAGNSSQVSDLSEPQPSIQQKKAARRLQPVASQSSHSYSRVSPLREDDTNKFICNADKNWTKKYDDLLVDWSSRYYNDWKKICRKFQKEQDVRVTPHFLRMKFRSLQTTKAIEDAATVLNASWDKRIVKLTLDHGLKWNLIAQKLEFSDPIKLKNRFYNHIKRKGRYEQIMEELAAEDEVQSKPIQEPTNQQPIQNYQEEAPHTRQLYSFSDGWYHHQPNQQVQQIEQLQYSNSAPQTTNYAPDDDLFSQVNLNFFGDYNFEF